MTDEEQWQINYHRDFEKEIRRLPKQEIKRILATIEALALEPKPHRSKKLERYDLWRVQVGVYRIIYQIDYENLVITTYRVGHRRDVYRNL
jgi:mRNA interferase RelE/StbE